MVRIGKYEVEPDSIGITVYYNGAPAGHIDGVAPEDLSEDELEELLYGDDDDCDYDELL